jgi:hypothetical protein
MAMGLAGFKGTRVYANRATPAQMLLDLRQLAAIDARCERCRRIATWTLVAAILTLVLAVIWPLPLDESIKRMVGIGAAAFIVASILMRLWFGRTDFSNNRYMLFGELLRLLGRDMAREAEVQAELDLAPPNVKRKYSSQGQIRQWKVTNYRDPWLRLAGRFADGTSFQIEVCELFQVRARWAQSRSGKSKHKSKTKTATRVSVKLYPKAGKYGDLDVIRDRALAFLKIPSWLQLKRLETTAESLAIVTATKVPWSVRRIASETPYDGVEMVGRMMLSLYQMLHFSKLAPK